MSPKPIDPYDRARRYRQVFLDAVGEADITAIADKLIEQAKAGDPRAIRYLLDLTIRQGGVEEWPSEASASFASTLRTMAAGG